MIPDVLKDMDAGGLFVLNERGEPSLIMKLPEGVRFGTETPIVYGAFEWYQYEREGVVIRTLIQLYENLEHLVDQPVAFIGIFVNPNNEQEKQALSALANVSYVWCLAWSRDRIFLGQRKLLWQDHNRESVISLLQKSEGTWTLWPDAKIRCMKENSLK
jgi:hypothetical protein